MLFRSGVACKSSTSTVAPSTSTATVVTDVFDGTLTPNGATTFPFNVSSSGTVYATLTTVADPAALVGFSLGTWNGASCTIVIANDQAAQGTIVAGAATGVGQLCVRVYDVGKVVDPLGYTITAVHP